MRTVVSLVLVVMLCGCEQVAQEEDRALVRLDEIEITVNELNAYEAKLTDDLKNSLVGEAAVRDLLRGMMDSEIMILEALSKNYDQDEEVVRRMQTFRANRLSGLLLREQLGDKVKVSEEQIETMYRELHWDRRVWPAHILSATEEDAREVLKELRKGREFSEVAKERSLADDAVLGGDLKQFFGPLDAATSLVRGAHGLPVGEVSEPIQTADGFEIITILDEQKVSLNEVRSQIARILHRKEFFKEHGKYVAQLESKFQVVYHEAGINALLRASSAGSVSLSDTDEDVPLVSYVDGAAVSAGEGSRALVTTGMPLRLLTDSLHAVQSLRVRLLADTLLVREAVAQGIDRRPDFVKEFEEQRRRVLVGQLRRGEVLRNIEITEEAIRKRYENEKEEYRLPMRADVTEILVDSEQRALELLRQIEAGANMEMLAVQHSQRPGARQNRGHLHITSGGDDWGALLDRAKAAEIGIVVGPVNLGDLGYSLLRVNERAGGIRTLEEVRHILIYKLKRMQNRLAFEQYIDHLRSKYNDRVEWNNELIAEVGSTRNE